MGSFKDVVGHKNIIEYIQNAVNANKVSHAYILNGERGSGKKMLATLFAETRFVRNREVRLVTSVIPANRQIVAIIRM